MTRKRLFDLCEGDRIKVYSAGRFEGEGIFIRFTEEKCEDFIYWIKRNGNDCYTSLDAINIEKIRYGYSYRDEQNYHDGDRRGEYRHDD
ncbi:hypothetical protein [Bacillus thuringiensis]|uniref:hypothetical protein n=1 Tax=Bacillus thuringiensis TaxID=1428 RepID=UPI001EDF727B|nr:hypothetical protein [Bacillus thuringiensis]MCG3426399.1 hypothetical protein [Bacillus thuringiensis]